VSQKDFEELLGCDSRWTGKPEWQDHQSVAVDSDRICEIVGQWGLMVESEDFGPSSRGLKAGMRL
jgi:hypothetical protein